MQPSKSLRRSISSNPNLRLLLTLLFLNAVGLHRPWDLRTYTGSELGLLTGRPQPYSYRHVERFLQDIGDRQC